MNTEWLNLARKGGGVTRMHTRPTIREHNVAEHTFNAVLIAFELIDSHPEHIRRDLNGSAVIRYLMTHDVPEAYFGDVPANAKAENGELRELLHRLEDKWARENIPEYMRPEIVPPESLLAKAADLLELAHFCVEEAELGNKKLRDVWDNITKYLTDRGCFSLFGVTPYYRHLEERWEKAHA